MTRRREAQSAVMQYLLVLIVAMLCANTHGPVTVNAASTSCTSCSALELQVCASCGSWFCSYQSINGVASCTYTCPCAGSGTGTSGGTSGSGGNSGSSGSGNGGASTDVGTACNSCSELKSRVCASCASWSCSFHSINGVASCSYTCPCSAGTVNPGSSGDGCVTHTSDGTLSDPAVSNFKSQEFWIAAAIIAGFMGLEWAVQWLLFDKKLIITHCLSKETANNNNIRVAKATLVDQRKSDAVAAWRNAPSSWCDVPAWLCSTSRLINESIWFLLKLFFVDDMWEPTSILSFFKERVELLAMFWGNDLAYRRTLRRAAFAMKCAGQLGFAVIFESLNSGSSSKSVNCVGGAFTSTSTSSQTDGIGFEVNRDIGVTLLVSAASYGLGWLADNHGRLAHDLHKPKVGMVALPLIGALWFIGAAIAKAVMGGGAYILLYFLVFIVSIALDIAKDIIQSVVVFCIGQFLYPRVTSPAPIQAVTEEEVAAFVVSQRNDAPEKRRNRYFSPKVNKIDVEL